MRNLYLLTIIVFFNVILNCRTDHDSLALFTIAKSDSIHQFGNSVLALNNLESFKEFVNKDNIQISTYAELLHKIGVYSYYSGLSSQAQRYLTTSIKIKEECYPSDNVNLFRSYYALGAAQKIIGNFSSSIKNIELAVDLIKDDGENIDRLTNAYEEYASVLMLTNNNEKAEVILNIIKGLYMSISPSNYKLGNLNQALAEANYRQNKLEEAMNYCKKSTGYYRNSKNNDALSSIAISYSIQSLIFLERNMFREATEYSLISLDILQKMFYESGNKFYKYEIINTYNNLINICTASNEFDSGLNYYYRVEEFVLCNLDNSYHYYLGETYQRRAELEMKRNNLESAKHYISKALSVTIIDVNFHRNSNIPIIANSLIISSSNLLDILNLNLDLQLLLFSQNNNSLELMYARRTIFAIDTLIDNIREKQNFTSSKYSLIKNEYRSYEKGISACLQLYDITKDSEHWESAYNLASKNKSLLMMQEINNKGLLKKLDIDNVIIEKLEINQTSLKEVEMNLIEALTRKNDLLFTELRDSLYFLERKQLDINVDINENYPNYYDLFFKQNLTASVYEIRKYIPEDQIFIEYFIGEKEIFIFAFSSSKMKSYRQPIPQNFEEMCTYASGENCCNSNSKKYLKSLFSLLLEKLLLDFNSKENFNRLQIIPDGSLWNISFEILNYSDKENFLLEDYAISYSYSSFSYLNSLKNKSKSYLNNYVGFGIDYINDKTLTHLYKRDSFITGLGLRSNVSITPYADDEIIKTASIVDGDYWINNMATKSTFLDVARSKSVVHLAMHGIVNKHNYMKSCLVFSMENDSSEYLLYASDILKYSMDAEMTVLSACNTNDGENLVGEGILSLGRAFMLAGSSSVIGSLWSANDYATSSIIVDFYSYLQSGDPKDIALQKAKLKYYRNAPPLFRNPQNWANLIIIGDVSPFESKSYLILILIAFAIIIIVILKYTIGKAVRA